jgi:hypothetical protein
MRIFLDKSRTTKISTIPIFWGLAIILGIVMCPSRAKSQVKLDANGHQWWQNAVFYEIYPRSFCGQQQ